MDISVLSVISNILLVTIPAAMVGGGLYWAIRAFIRRDQDLKIIELRAQSGKETRLLRLQAYERLVLFLERISLDSVISRVLDDNMNNTELQFMMTQAIKAEFEHIVRSLAAHRICQRRDHQGHRPHSFSHARRHTRSAGSPCHPRIRR